MYEDNDDIQIYALTNYVPAVAVIRKRLVLFIFNRFKGYLSGRYSLIIDTYRTRVLCRKVELMM